MKPTNNIASSDRRLVSIEKYTKPTSLIVSVLLAVVLLVPIVMTIPSPIADTFWAVSWILWGYLCAEFVVRLFIAKEKGRFLRDNVVDLAVVVIPLFTPFVPYAQLAQPLRAIRIIFVVTYALQHAENVFVARNFPYAAIIVGLTLVVCSALEYGFERNASHATIHTFGDALWWAIVTITTVGYGDMYPVTAGGRGVAVVLMLVGISFAGILAASLVSVFVRNDRTPQSAGLHRVELRLTELEAKIDLLLGQKDADRG